MRKREFDNLALPAPDRDLIEDFLKAVQEWAPTSLKSIILYGSVAKSIFPEEYDIDVVLLFSSDFDHTQFYSDIYRIVRTLQPHREMHIVLEWEGEIEPAYRELIEGEGIALYP
ncbi:MAG: nucleotidyltransferase domain-containing protein [Halobacteriota archaeon]|jgi:predicted nucleotidyltransferase|nr:nucleotidyltransferase domain-containing protein [Euryarchaeota archaeon]